MTNKIFIIAEAGHNHMGYMRHAKLLIEEAKACGADAIKFQFYDVNKIKKPWQSRYFELLLSEHTFEEAKELKEYCDKVGIEFMASAFDVERLGWLEELGVKRHKVASRSIYEKDMIEGMEKTGKPIPNIIEVRRGRWVHIYTEEGHEYIVNPNKVLFIRNKKQI